MTTAPSNQPAVVSSPSGEDEINLRQVAGALGRHRSLIAKVRPPCFSVGSMPSPKARVGRAVPDCARRSERRRWRLAQLAANPMLANLAGLGGSGTSSLETEVKILETRRS